MKDTKKSLGVVAAASILSGGALVAPATVSAESEPYLPLPTGPGIEQCVADVLNNPCGGELAASGSIRVRNRGKNPSTKTVEVIIKNPDGVEVARERVTVEVAGRSVEHLSPGEFIDLSNLATDAGTYRYVVRNVRADGTYGRRNTRGTFEVIAAVN